MTERTVIKDIASLRTALAPLAKIFTAWRDNGLDEDRPDWRNNGVGESPPFDQVELYTGRGGRRLLTLQDAKNAHDALNGVVLPAHPEAIAEALGGADNETSDKCDHPEPDREFVRGMRCGPCGAVELVIDQDPACDELIQRVYANGLTDALNAIKHVDTLGRADGAIRDLIADHGKRRPSRIDLSRAFDDIRTLPVTDERTLHARNAIEAAVDVLGYRLVAKGDVTPQQTVGRMLEDDQRSGLLKVTTPLALPKMGDEYRVVATDFHTDRPNTVSLMRINHVRQELTAPRPTVRLSLAQDIDYLHSADAHRDEGNLGERAARSILDIALHWSHAYDALTNELRRWPIVDVGTEITPEFLRKLYGMIQATETRCEELGVEVAHLLSQVGEPTADQRKAAIDASALLTILIGGRDYLKVTDDQWKLLASVRNRLRVAFKIDGIEMSDALFGDAAVDATIPPVEPIASASGAFARDVDGTPASKEGAAVHAAYCNTVITRRMLPRQPCNCSASPHAPDCATKCRQQAMHKHDCDCGQGVTS